MCALHLLCEEAFAKPRMFKNNLKCALFTSLAAKSPTVLHMDFLLGYHRTQCEARDEHKQVYTSQGCIALWFNILFYHWSKKILLSVNQER